MNNPEWPEDAFGPKIKCSLRIWTPEFGVREQSRFMPCLPNSAGRPILKAMEAEFAIHVFALDCQAAILLEHQDGTVAVAAHHSDFDQFDDFVRPENAIQ